MKQWYLHLVISAIFYLCVIVLLDFSLDQWCKFAFNDTGSKLWFDNFSQNVHK